MYFIKYTPIEGEPKEGDTVHFPHSWIGTVSEVVGNMIHANNGSESYLTSEKEKFTKVELSVCVKDTEKGGEAYKVIGQVSVGCPWVTEGMEFQKEDLLANGCASNWNEDYGRYRFKIKCPTCKMFH
jgi:hypothetical protein